MRFRTWVLGVAALLTLMVVMAVIFVVTGDMNPPQKNPTEGRYTGVIYKTPHCGCCEEYRYLERYGVTVEVVHVDDICSKTSLTCHLNAKVAT
jgi:hypothetical protein